MQDVDLVEGDDDGTGEGTDRHAPRSGGGDAAGPPPGTGPTGAGPVGSTSGARNAPSTAPSTHDRHRRRRLVVLTATTLVLVVAGAAAVQARDDARERARVASISADVALVAEPLTDPPTTRWTTPATSVLGWSVRVDDALVGVSADGADGPEVLAVDTATGAELWRTAVPTRAVADDPDRPEARSPVVEPPAARSLADTCVAHPAVEHAVACLVTDADRLIPDGGSATPRPTVVAMVVLDTRDGRLLQDLTDDLPHPTPTRITTTGDGPAVWDVADDVLRVRAFTRDGDVAWDHEASAPPDGRRDVTPLADGVLAVITPRTVQLLDTAGRVLRVVDLPPDSSVERLDAARLVVAPGAETYQRSSDGSSTTTPDELLVVGVHGEVRVEGRYVPSEDDGSVPGLLLTQVDRRTLQAWDGDGTPLWTWALDGAASSFDQDASTTVLDGRVLLASPGRLVALDAWSGAELWRSAELTSARIMTDGHLVVGVAQRREHGEGGELVALRRDDGTVAWRAPLPAGADGAVVAFGLLVAYESREDGALAVLHVLGPPG
jgi:outer membrane protein assembly factor BamB